jgi:hypothetical protein
MRKTKNDMSDGGLVSITGCAARTLRFAGAVVSCIALAACGPDYAKLSNSYREETLKQRGELGDLREQLKNRDATIRDLRANVPTIPTLPPERMAQLFSAVRLEVTSQTEARDLADGAKGFRVFIRAYTEDAQTIPATGALTIEAFELPAAPAQPRRVGVWKFTPEEMKKNWYSGLGAYHFAFSCPFQTVPTMTNITFKARLQDALTGHTLEAQLDKKVTFP